jgi:hypothetical protein
MPVPDYMTEKLAAASDFADQESLRKRLGVANWRAFQSLDFGLERILSAAENWRKSLEGIELPWLVWSIDDDWCYVQQQLVHLVGWTPVVGFDPRAGAPAKRFPGAVLVDFNENLNLPVMYMHFPLDFVFAFAPRLAFWHSDLLCTRNNMQYLADLFRSLKDGEVAIAVPTENRIANTIAFWRRSQRRFWELAGCITAGASRDMFGRGCGIWMSWSFHPNCPDAKEFRRRQSRYWDHGAGLRYWHERYAGPVKLIPEARLAEGHFSRTRDKNFRVVTPVSEDRNSGIDLRENFTAWQAAGKLGILDLLQQR